GEENWFFKLSEFQQPLLDFYAANPDFIRPETRKNEIVTFVEGGLKDLSISRSTFDWGVPLPFDEGHVCYVWADALLAYITGIGYGDPEREGEFERRWPMQYHFVGKDITRFHCVIWPAMLMAAGLPVTGTVFGHGFLLTKGEKMSKSKGNALRPADLCAVFGVDAYRYYFMSDVQFGHDGSISLERMVQVYNNELANTWGNLCSRVFNMTKKYFGGVVPEVPAEFDGVENPLADVAAGLYARYDEALGKVDFSGATAAVQELAGTANLYVEQQAPFRLAKDPEKAGELAFVMYNLLEAIRIIALYLAPFMPNTSAEVFRRLGLGDITALTDIEAATAWGQLPAGNAVEVGDPLFPRLDEDAINMDVE
ncbi:MAG: class I tRNA ligase family protein, partial [Eggerthellaceae bacterium]|nr:class I tRNA ligase family protein [Eggerthellaceae bacterium]